MSKLFEMIRVNIDKNDVVVGRLHLEAPFDYVSIEKRTTTLTGCSEYRTDIEVTWKVKGYWQPGLPTDAVTKNFVSQLKLDMYGEAYAAVLRLERHIWELGPSDRMNQIHSALRDIKSELMMEA